MEVIRESTLPAIAENNPSIFNPQIPKTTPFTDLPDEIWQPMLESQCTFDLEMFLPVMHNLIKNPNIMSTHLFRADILYDSRNDHTIVTEPGTVDFSPYTKNMKQELRPLPFQVPDYQWQQTYVRQLVPRNRQLDKDLVQTCHFFLKRTGDTTTTLIIYIPHVSNPEEMPWYHPKVKQLAFLHEWKSSAEQGVSGSVSVHFCPFTDITMDQRLERTALQLLSKIHKHGRGQEKGYVKRVHHDQIVPQQIFQDTYSRLKAKYARHLIDNWAERTDPSKHVFEDLGIAAFLIELWAEMYDCSTLAEPHLKNSANQKPKFPGFVDIGCGNGLLISLLEQEGYHGWGFDARQRKTWETFNPEVQKNVKELVLVPKVLGDGSEYLSGTQVVDAEDQQLHERVFHNGIFKPINGASEPPFIVSNHADELTPWTPLLAYLNGASFIAIPCCSHNLTGARWRAPNATQTLKDRKEEHKKEQTKDKLREQQAAETGSLKRPAGPKMPSAYSSLCDYVTGLANEVGYTIEKEMLRIPSTRNACLLGRFKRETRNTTTATTSEDSSLSDSSLDQNGVDSEAYRTKSVHVNKILVRELGVPVDVIREEWIVRAKQIAGKKADGH